MHNNGDTNGNSLLPNMKIGSKLATNDSKHTSKMMIKSSSVTQLRDPFDKHNDLGGTVGANFFSNRNSQMSLGKPKPVRFELT